MRARLLLVLTLALVGSACEASSDAPTIPAPPEPVTTTTAPEPTTIVVPAPEPATDPATAEVPQPDPAPVVEELDPVVPLPEPTPTTVPEPEPVEPVQEPAVEVTDAPPADPPQPGSPLDSGDGIILGAITPDGRPDNGLPDNRHQGDRTLAVYVEGELRPLNSHLATWLREWNSQRSWANKWPYFTSASYVGDCRWRGTGTVVVCGITDAEMIRLAGTSFTGLAKAQRIDERHHIVGGSAILINVEKVGVGSHFDAPRVLRHENGHVKGLGHQGTDSGCGEGSDPASLMSYCPGSMEYDDDDVAALNRLYAH